MLSLKFAGGTERRMNGHVKTMQFQQLKETTAALFPFLLLMALHSTKTVGASRNQTCGSALQRTLQLSRVVQKESTDLLQIYKTSQGEVHEFVCKAPFKSIPDPNISGLEASDRISSIYTHLQSFTPHLKQVLELQTNLQPPDSPVLSQLTRVRSNSRNLLFLVHDFYRNVFPNLPLPEPSGGPTPLPPPLNVFQQKIYGCLVLRTYKELVRNVSKEFRGFRGKLCRKGAQRNVFF